MKRPIHRLFVLCIIAVSFSLLLTSCFEKDEQVPPYPGQVVTIENNIENFQSYFDFGTNLTVSVNSIDTWQLGFETKPAGWHITVNSGDNWFIWNSHQSDFEMTLNPPSHVLWPYDIQSAFPDSTSTGDWTTSENGERNYTNDVYLLGKYSQGQYVLQKRIQFLHVDSTGYRFCYRNEDSGLSDTVSIMKADSVNFVYYDFTERAQQNLEPNDTSYDIVFGSYYDLATEFGITIPYLVRGVFLNLNGTSAVLDSLNSYDEINYDRLKDYVFTTQRDIIGYRWKDVNVDISSGSAQYTVRDNYTYIIRTSDGRYYKMHFLSFSLNGISGFPRFEFRELKPTG
jgi:hypothetical protein